MPAENGYVPTPPVIADIAASHVFGLTRPDQPENPRLLLPGLGTGRLYDAVLRYCTEGEGAPMQSSWSFPVPEIVAVENDPVRIREFYAEHPESDIEIIEGDFLTDPPSGQFDWVLMNPPFMRYNRLPEDRREWYAEEYWVAFGQFGLYAPFVEQALRLLRPGGELTTFLPTAALTKRSTRRLRTLWRKHSMDYIQLLPRETFPVKVETVLMEFQKQPDADVDGRPYITYMDGWDIPRALAALLDEDRESDVVDEASSTYFDRYEDYRRILRGVNRRDTDDGIERPPSRPPGRTREFDDDTGDRVGYEQTMATSW